MCTPDRSYLWPVNRPTGGRPRLVAALLVFVVGLAISSFFGCSNANGLRKGGPDASVDLHGCVPNASVDCACASGQQGVQICTSAGILPPCQCATPDGAEGGDSTVDSDGAASIDAGGALSCNDLSLAASNGLARVTDADCQSDADCTTILVAGTCFAFCSLTLNIANVAAVEAAENQLCQPFFAQKCQVYQMPCPATHAPSCVAGICQTGYGTN